VADILVVNKADREGADRTYQDLLTMLDLRFARKTPAWMPRIYLTQASKDQGVAELLAGIREHQEFLARENGQALRAARRQRLRQEFLELLKEGVFTRLVSNLSRDGRLEAIVDDILERRTDPYTASEALIDQTLHLP
jgi:LAO/AO transport system kinase